MNQVTPPPRPTSEPIDPFKRSSSRKTVGPAQNERGGIFTDAVKARIAGALMVAGGAVLGKITVWDVLQSAKSGAPSVNYNVKGVILAGVFPVLGAILLVTGARGKQALAADFKSANPLQIISLIVALGSGITLLFWLRSQLADTGFDN